MTGNLSAALQTIAAVLLASLFSRVVGQGWLSPEQATAFQNWIMDGVAVGVPAALAWFAARAFKRENLIVTTNATPGVKGVAVTPELANKIDEPTVTTIEQLPAEVKKAEVLDKILG